MDAIKRLQAAEECGRKLQVLRTDNGGELMAAEHAVYYVDEGIQRTIPRRTRRSRSASSSLEHRN